MSHATMGAALGAWPFVYLGVSAITGKFLDRYGIQIGLSLGALFIGVSGILRAGAQSGLGLWMAVAVFGLGGPFISIGAPKLVTEWFPVAQRGLAVGLYSTASSLGAITALVVADPIALRWEVGVGLWCFWCRFLGSNCCGSPLAPALARRIWHLLRLNLCLCCRTNDFSNSAPCIHDFFYQSCSRRMDAGNARSQMWSAWCGMANGCWGGSGGH